MPKKTRKKSFSIRWHKQSVAIKAALITGFFSLTAALCVLFGTVLAPIVENVTERTEPTIGIFVQFDEFNWAVGLDAIDVTDTQDSHYSIVTGTCLELVEPNGVMIRTIEDKSKPVQYQYLSGTFAVTVFADTPVIIDHMDLVILDFSPPDVNPHPLTWTTGGGGIGWTNEVPVDPIVFHPTAQTYEIVKARRYQLSQDDSVTFMIPVEFPAPGSYRIQENVFATSYNDKLISGSGAPFTMKWLKIDSIDPKDVQISEGMEGIYGDLDTRLCP